MDLEIFDSVKGKALRTTKFINAGESIVEFTGVVKDYPDMYSIQISEGKHLHGVDAPEFLNHSCDPTCYISFTNGVWLVAKRDITEGEELTFDYNTTEYEMNCPFECKCGSANCRKQVRGYKYI